MSDYKRDRMRAGAMASWDRALFERRVSWARGLGLCRRDDILDFGAGNAPYRFLFECRRYVLADVEQNVEGAVDWVFAPEEPRLPASDETFDLVLCLDVLEHVREQEKALREIRRVLKTGGELWLSVPFMYRQHEIPNDHRRYTEFGIKRLLDRHGFEITALRKEGNAWSVALTAVLERFCDQPGRIPLLGRATRKLLAWCMPLLIWALYDVRHDNVFHGLLILARKSA